MPTKRLSPQFIELIIFNRSEEAFEKFNNILEIWQEIFHGSTGYEQNEQQI